MTRHEVSSTSSSNYVAGSSLKTRVTRQQHNNTRIAGLPSHRLWLREERLMPRTQGLTNLA